MHVRFAHRNRLTQTSGLEQLAVEKGGNGFIVHSGDAAPLNRMSGKINVKRRSLS